MKQILFCALHHFATGHQVAQQERQKDELNNDVRIMMIIMVTIITTGA
jgi:hypothetical protein